MRSRAAVRRGAAAAGVLVFVLFLLSGTVAVRPAAASLSRNPAGAKNIGESGTVTVDIAGQFDSESDARTWTFGPGVQVQVSSRLQFLAEAVVYTRVRSEDGEVASGLGDTELTLSWLAARQRGARPSAVLGGMVKLPSASNRAIGSGKADGSALLVLGQEQGDLETSLELEYATFGSPDGESLDDQFLYTLTGEWGVSDLLAVYAEIYGNSAPSPAETRSDAALVGLEVDVPAGEWASPYLSFELDTEGGASARAGIEWSW